MNEQTPQIIDRVPGMENTQMPDEAAQIIGREIVHIAEEDFKGDPSRIPGHPSNQNFQIASAAAKLYEGESSHASDDMQGIPSENIITADQVPKTLDK